MIDYASNLLGLSNLIIFDIIDLDAQQIYNSRAACDRNTYTIFFDYKWLHTASDIEIFACVLHECRHCYQQACIDFPDVFDSEPKEIVNEWKKDFDNLVDPNINEIEYLHCKTEIDARNYADNVIKKIVEKCNY